MTEAEKIASRDMRIPLRIRRDVLSILVLVFLTGSVTLPQVAIAGAASENHQIDKEDGGQTVKEILLDIKNELQGIRQLLLQQGRPQPRSQPTAAASPSPLGMVRVNAVGNAVMGKKDAPVTIVEFSDYQCPFCRRFFTSTLPALRAEYIDTGKVRYVFRDFPLSMHPLAWPAAEAALCAGDQGKYWEMHDILFQNQPAFEIEQLKTDARTLGLDEAGFVACIEKRTYRGVVQKNFEEGDAVGIQGTPGFIIGRTTPDGMIQAIALKGAQPLPVFRQVIDRLLTEK